MNFRRQFCSTQHHYSVFSIPLRRRNDSIIQTRSRQLRRHGPRAWEPRTGPRARGDGRRDGDSVRRRGERREGHGRARRDPAAPVADFAQKYSRLSASDLARVVSLQARFRGNARRARLMKSRLSSAHAAGGAFAIFGLPDANERLITVIPCSLGSSSLVGAGNLYVFSKHVGFHRPNGWSLWGPHKAITLLLLDHVATVRVEEEYVTAPGVTVRMRNGDDHWFGTCGRRSRRPTRCGPRGRPARSTARP